MHMTVNSRLQNVKSSTMNQLKSMPEYLKLIVKTRLKNTGNGATMYLTIIQEYSTKIIPKFSGHEVKNIVHTLCRY